jgi:hypothetical protein
MTAASQFAEYAARLRVFMHDALAGSAISEPSVTSDLEETFSRLALNLFALQFLHNPAYRRLCDARAVFPDGVGHWQEIPAVPTSAFKELDMTSLPPSGRVVAFHSSGTTEQRRSRHYHDADSLALYEASLLPWFQRHLLPRSPEREVEALGTAQTKAIVLSLTPDTGEVPNSSLVHMFEAVRTTFGSPESAFVGKLEQDRAWGIDVASLRKRLNLAECNERPVILLGSAFNFVHLLDDVNSVGSVLPQGSLVLETGGYKGRSRTMPKAELHHLIARRLGVPPSRIVTEYGMSELSSQAYDCIAGGPESADPDRRVFRFPPWARAQVVSPESGREVAEGETGLLRIFDLANARSVMAVQTEDLAVRRADGFALLGRAVHAEPRGCSLMAV